MQIKLFILHNYDITDMKQFKLVEGIIDGARTRDKHRIKRFQLLPELTLALTSYEDEGCYNYI